MADNKDNKQYKYRQEIQQHPAPRVGVVQDNTMVQTPFGNMTVKLEDGSEIHLWDLLTGRAEPPYALSPEDRVYDDAYLDSNGETDTDVSHDTDTGNGTDTDHGNYSDHDSDAGYYTDADDDHYVGHGNYNDPMISANLTASTDHFSSTIGNENDEANTLVNPAAASLTPPVMSSPPLDDYPTTDAVDSTDEAAWPSGNPVWHHPGWNNDPPYGFVDLLHTSTFTGVSEGAGAATGPEDSRVEHPHFGPTLPFNPASDFENAAAPGNAFGPYSTFGDGSAFNPEFGPDSEVPLDIFEYGNFGGSSDSSKAVKIGEFYLPRDSGNATNPGESRDTEDSFDWNEFINFGDSPDSSNAMETGDSVKTGGILNTGDTLNVVAAVASGDTSDSGDALNSGSAFKPGNIPNSGNDVKPSNPTQLPMSSADPPSDSDQMENKFRLSKTDKASAYELVHGKLLPPLTSLAGASDDELEDADEFKKHLTDIIVKMMYVSGETGEPSAETTGMIEEIVRQQVVEMLRNCTELAARRGSRSITINDLIFQIRHDAPKVSRLRTFLSWKDVRKNVKDSDDKAGDADLAAAEDPAGGVVANGPVDDAAKKNKKAKVGLPWEPSSFYSQEVPEREDEEDEEEEEMNYITLQRLRKADERTKAMTKEEYVTWSEFRQASFTYRKSKRFREWAGFSLIMDSKPSDDIVDILGFLTFEMVQTLTEEALKMKEHEDLLKERTGENAGTKKRKLAQGLFDPPSEGRTPVEPRHIQEAFRRLQARPKKSRAMLNGTKLQQRSNLKLI